MSPARTVLGREELFFLAELAGEAGRHEDVIKQIKLIVDRFGPQLSTEERSLLSVACKTTTNTLRNSWRVIDALYKVQSTRKAPIHLIQRQRDCIESELTGVCRDVIRLLDRQLLPAATEGEETVFYSKLKGDYCRYLAELGLRRDRERFAELSLKAYRSAYKHAQATLHPLHPTRLGLALNFSVYYHDIKTSPERACHLAKSAFDDAVLSVDASDAGLNQILRDSMAILQLLRDDILFA